MNITSRAGKRKRERNKEEICLSVNSDPLNLLSPVKGRGGGSGSGSAFCKSSDEMLTKQPIFCNFPAAVFQQLTHSEPPHFKPQHTATSDMYLLWPGRKTVTVVPFRSGGCRLRRQHNKGRLCLWYGLSWAPVKKIRNVVNSSGVA